MDVLKMSKVDFDKVERVKWDKQITCSSLVIIPTDDIHGDSGYACMDFVAVDENHEPLCRWSNGSDVLAIDGIGGYGNWRIGQMIPISRPIQAWHIDCLPCGYLRIFNNGEIDVGAGMSSFNIYHRPGKPEND